MFYFRFVMCLSGLLALPSWAAPPLTFERAVELAAAEQPLLAGQSAAIAAAEQDSIAARQLPDPKLKLGIINLPAGGPDAYSLSRDFMTMRMIGVMQEFPRAEKRRLRGERAHLEAEKETRDLAVLRRTLKREAGLAWLAAYYPEQALHLVQALAQETELQSAALEIAYRAGRAAQSEVLASRVALDLLQDRASELEREAAAAHAMLVRWIGAAGRARLAAELPRLPPPSDVTLLRQLEQHPHLDLMEKQVALAQAEVDLARANRKPDWNMELSYNQRGSQYADMVSLQFGIDLPIFPANRQDRELAAKQARLEKSQAQREDNLREMRAEIERFYADWRTANGRRSRFEQAVLPQSQARVAAALSAYRAGQGGLAAVLEARRAELDVRMQRLALQVDAARAQVQLQYFSEAGEGETP